MGVFAAAGLLAAAFTVFPALFAAYAKGYQKQYGIPDAELERMLWTSAALASPPDQVPGLRSALTTLMARWPHDGDLDPDEAAAAVS